MGGRKKLDLGNRRLDLFLKELNEQQEARQKVIDYVQDLTFKQMQDLSKPKLRLNK